VVGPVTLTDMVRYQGASGDFNPLHHDAAVAREAGFPAPVVVGMYVAGLMATWAGDWLGPRQVRRLGTRFQQPVLIGDTLEILGAVSGVDDGPDGRSVHISMSCRRLADSTEVATGWATYIDGGGER
jgi:acyl dehydratase